MISQCEKMKWIKIEQEMPPFCEKVILRFIERGNVKKNIVSLIYPNEWVLHSYHAGVRMDRGEFTPTHWMRLPPEPKD